MSTIKKTPQYINVTSINQIEEDDMATSMIASGSFFMGQLWNSDLEKIRVWNSTLQVFENTVEVDKLSSHIIVKRLSDFPTPVSGVITLANNTTYEINGTVDIGVNRIVCGIKNSFVGVDRVNDKLLSTTTGIMFDMDGTSGSKSNILFSDITIGAVNGTLLNVISSSQNQAVGMINVTIAATNNLGVMNNISTWAMTNCVMRNTVINSGFVITGNNGTIKSRLAVFSNNVGTMFDFTNSTNEVIDFNNNQISSSTGQTFMSALPANVSVWGKINNNCFTGVGNYITGVSALNNFWKFAGNLGLDNNGSFSEVLIGTIDGANSVFTTSVNFPATGVKIFVNGTKQTIINDYQLSNNNTISFTFSPNVWEILTIEY